MKNSCFNKPQFSALSHYFLRLPMAVKIGEGLNNKTLLEIVLKISSSLVGLFLFSPPKKLEY